jgi:hypothetical protein
MIGALIYLSLAQFHKGSSRSLILKRTIPNLTA